MSPKVSVIMLGVRDVARAKKFYVEGLGAAVEQDYPGFVSLSLGEDPRRWLSTVGTLPRRTRGSRRRDPDSAASRFTSSPTPAKRWTK